MYLVTYDVGDNKERTRIARVIEQYGIRVQLSVWLCRQPPSAMHRLRDRLRDLGVETGSVDIWALDSLICSLGRDNPIKEECCHII